MKRLVSLNLVLFRVVSAVGGEVVEAGEAAGVVEAGDSGVVGAVGVVEAGDSGVVGAAAAGEAVGVVMTGEAAEAAAMMIGGNI